MLAWPTKGPGFNSHTVEEENEGEEEERGKACRKKEEEEKACSLPVKCFSPSGSPVSPIAKVGPASFTTNP